MTTITSYIEGFDALVSCLNKADAATAKQLLAKLPKKPTVSTWQAYKLVSRAVAKFHRSASEFENLQYKFYHRCNLNEITHEIIREHLELDEAGKRKAIDAERLRKELEKENQRKQDQELYNNGF